MKYGKTLRDEIEKTFPEWGNEFISYKMLKKEIKLMRIRSTENKQSRFVVGSLMNFFQELVNLIRHNFGFIRLLDGEIDKINAFYADKEEDYIIRLKELQIRVADLDCEEEKLQVQMDILDFHAQMISLLRYSVLNVTGLIKIVKKHKKKTGTSVHFCFMPGVLQQPFFSTELLCELMKECEVMLHCLFVAEQS